MKLHLPKLLSVAVMAALALPAMGADTTNENTPTYINVGIAGTANSYTDNNYTHTTTDGTLHIGTGDKVGYFKVEGDPSTLVTKFDDAYASGNIGTANVSNFLTIYAADGKTKGNLEISGTGQVYLGGKNGKNFFSGLVAKDVTISSDATGTNLWADSTALETFTINGGSAYLRTNLSQGNSTFGNGFTSYKSNTITKGLYINGGFLKMGRQANGATVGAGDRNKTNEHFVNIIGGTVKQTNGEAELHGKTYISASKVEQTGGKMKLAYDATNGYEFLRFGNSNTTICQDATDASTNMHIEGQIIYGTKGNSSMVLNIEQKGVGTISLDNGVMFTSASSDKASNILQSGNGTINLGGDYSSAIFNINQSASGTINLKKNAAMVANNVNVGKDATLNVDGNMTFTGKASLTGTVNVGANTSFTLTETCDMDVMTDLELSAGNSIKFIVDSATTEGSMQMTETGNLEFTGGTLELSLTEAALTEIAAEAHKDGKEVHVTLIGNLSDADVLELEGIINDKLVLADYLVELELPTTYALTAQENITIEAHDLIVEDNALKAVIIATNPNVIPEPATATLSLLALAALAARRRRK